MDKFDMSLAFVLGAVLSWGVYVPVLHEGQMKMGGDPGSKSLRGFLCVGIAYFVTAVLVPVALLLLRGQAIEFSVRGATFATLGGVAGAAGALCIILAAVGAGLVLYSKSDLDAKLRQQKAAEARVQPEGMVPGPLAESH